MPEILKSIGGLLIGIAILVLSIIVPVLLIKGSVWIGVKVLPWLSIIMWIVFVIDIFVIFPLGLFRKTKGVSGAGLVISSYVYGLTLWFWALLITYFTWGLLAVFIGLVIVGIGVVPIAILASIVKGQWATLGQIILFIVLTFGSRALGLYFGERADKLAYDE